MLHTDCSRSCHQLSFKVTLYSKVHLLAFPQVTSLCLLIYLAAALLFPRVMWAYQSLRQWPMFLVASCICPYIKGLHWWWQWPVCICSPLQVDPKDGTVGFGSGLHGWAFTLKDFAKLYSSKFNMPEEKLMKRLWGDQFYHAGEKKWIKDQRDNACRGFTQYILNPIYQVRQHRLASGDSVITTM